MEILIIFTNQYPYGKGEEFLETELPVISKKFDNVIVFAIGISKVDGEIRKLPPNVKAYAVGTDSNRLFRLFKYLINSLASLRIEWIRGAILRETSLRKKIQCINFSGRGRLLYKRILKILKNGVFLEASKVTLYSYWLIEAPFLMKLLGRDLQNHNVRFTSLSRAHGYDLYEERTKLGFFPFREYYLEFLDNVFPCSDSGTKYLKDKYSRYNKKISTRRLGTKDYGLFPYFRNNEVINIVSCSYVVPVKQLDFLVRVLALAELRGAFKYRWTHIGGGAGLDSLREQIEKNLEPSNVVLLGHLENKELMQFYLSNSLDLFINVSISEGIPVSIMEAISGGIPCIAPRVGGIPEIVFDKRNGYLFDPEAKEEDVLELISSFHKQSDLAIHSLRNQAREIWKSRYSAETNYAAFANNFVEYNSKEFY